MEPERTTTMGEGESVARERVFQSMKAVLRIRVKLRAWRASWRGEPRELNIVVVFGEAWCVEDVARVRVI